MESLEITNEVKEWLVAQTLVCLSKLENINLIPFYDAPSKNINPTNQSSYQSYELITKEVVSLLDEIGLKLNKKKTRKVAKRNQRCSDKSQRLLAVKLFNSYLAVKNEFFAQGQVFLAFVPAT